MSFKNNTCPRCQSELSHTDIASLKRKELRGGMAGLVLGLIGAGLGIYFGVNA